MARLLEAVDGDMVFNWQALPEPLRSNEKARDTILTQLQNQFGNAPVDPPRLFEINKTAMELIKKLK